ncbi:hypothetical protein GCM10020358_80920 [Amorphoplanes nipponensis]|uniref:HTH luxR-type domain-containing protein n=1 Tax=Actinoplanes nipponensis TaxID=135950 RepID=A0A919JH40_9ACTN|nr:LuxR C-terminal-related transcriptional regulator [Actinoplanes nipponensis]GIE49270.1 hypothetical protein Ani05nite_28040 [Actinoplanes nipponensis]
MNETRYPARIRRTTYLAYAPGRLGASVPVIVAGSIGINAEALRGLSDCETDGCPHRAGERLLVGMTRRGHDDTPDPESIPASMCGRERGSTKGPQRACGVDPSEMDRWRNRWERARAEYQVQGLARRGAPAAEQIRVMIGVSSPLLRGALAIAMTEQGIAVVGLPTNVIEAASGAAALDPAVLVADLRTPADLRGLLTFATMCPGCAIVAVTGSETPAWLGTRSHLFGGLVSADSHPIELAAGIRSAAARRRRAGRPTAEVRVVEIRPAEAVEAAGAARAATSTGDFAEASRQWRRALDLTSHDMTERTTMLQHAAEAAYRHGDYPRALALLTELADRPDNPSQCDVHLRRARCLAAAGRAMLAEAEYELAMDACDVTPQHRAAATAHLAELLLYLGRYADANTKARVALDLVTRSASTTDLVRASAAFGYSSAFLGDPYVGLSVVRRAVALAERSGHPDDLGVAYLHLAELLAGPLNNVEEGVLAARRGADQLSRLGAGPTYQARLLAVAGNCLFRVGQWAEAEEVLEAAMRLRPSGADTVELLLARCRLSVGVGDAAAANRDLDAVATITANEGARHVMPMLTLRAGLAIWQGDFKGARDTVQRALLDAGADDLIILGVLAWHGLRAEAAASAAGEPVAPWAVRRLGAVVSRIADGVSNAALPVRQIIDAYLALCRAETSRIDQRHDPEPWAKAATAWDRRHQPYPAAYARLRYAEATLRRSSSRISGTRALRQAHATAMAMGARPFAAEIGEVARRYQVTLGDDANATLHPISGCGRGGELGILTQREREVLAAVAEGLTNREIGERLFISERTVGVHVGHIFDKLQVRTRVQASRMYLTAA